MSAVYKKITLVGTSTKNYEDAIKSALDRAEETIENLEWFEVDELRGGLAENNSIEFQAVVKAAFKLK